MCGICGYVGVHEDGLLENMTRALAHRGPDSEGYFREGDVGLGHRRLSIIDVGGGQQPIENEDGSLTVICNGEIYNYQALREDLIARGHRFRTHSDNEVILHLYEDEGPACITRLIGMFAFALYDRRRRRLFVGRDRLGIKPLYYLNQGERFLFASESKALMTYRGFTPTLNHQAVHDYLALRYVPGPGGMIKEILKFPQAHYAVVENGRVHFERYWTPALYHGPFEGSEDDYLEGFAEHFERSIRRRMISDVPLGAYLSGGLDSSAIVAAMARLSNQPVKTFTVGFDYQYDELSEAAETARHLGCDHTEITWGVSDIELLPKLVWHLDEPLGDPIVIPMYQLAREAKKQVTVILAGEGADEIMGGYLFHKALLAGHGLSRVIPALLRRTILTQALALTPPSVINLAFSYPAALGKRGKMKVIDYLNLLAPQQLNAAYLHLISLFDQRDTGGLYTDDFADLVDFTRRPGEDPDIVGSDAPYLNRVIHLQFAHWLPDDILMKQDKMSMASAIEARVPFLDHELVEYALKIPPRLKIRSGKSKYLVRRYAGRLLPEQNTTRRKMPFYVPLEKYAAEPAFRTLIDETLNDRAVKERGLFRPEAVQRLRRSIDAGEFIYVKQLFSLVVLELWFRTFWDRRGLEQTF